MEKRKILIAAAWPYGNNSMHLGNPRGSILQLTDVLARYQQAVRGDDVLHPYVSGTDCHGTASITITAEKRTTQHPDKAVADKYHKEFCKGQLKSLDDIGYVL